MMNNIDKTCILQLDVFFFGYQTVGFGHHPEKPRQGRLAEAGVDEKLVFVSGSTLETKRNY